MENFRRVFVTGAGSGLGAGLVGHYGREGAHLGLVGRREALLREQQVECEGRGARVEVYAGDVADTDFMQQSAGRFLEAAGGVDLVVANAGIAIANRVREGEAHEVARLINVNLVGVTNTLLPFVPGMIEQGRGTLCAMSSFTAHRGLPGRTAYGASKAGVTAFTDGLRMELHDTGVHAMALHPGFVDTPLTRDNPEMIFLIDLDHAVACMASAIERGARNHTFPWQMNLLKEVVKHAPESIIRRLAPAPRPTSMK